MFAESQALPADPFERVAIVVHPPRTAEDQAHFRLDDAERCPEFVGSVRGELELATARLFDRAGGLEADEQGAEEHRDEKHRTRHDLDRQQVGLDVVNLGQALSRNEPSAPHAP